MNIAKYLEPLDISKNFFYNLNNTVEQNNNQIKVNNYRNLNINPPFRNYTNDINLTPKIVPNYTYKNKSLFSSEKPSQTENDIIPVNEDLLNSFYGYTNYGNFKVANQSLPENWKHKPTPKNNLFELL